MKRMGTRFPTKMRVVPKIPVRESMKNPKEDDVQMEVVRALLSSRKVSFFHSIPNEARGRSRATQSRLVSMGLSAGVADLFVWWADGTYGYMEVKTRSGQLSQKQKEFRRRCHERGIEYLGVRSGRDVFKAAKAHAFEDMEEDDGRNKDE